MPNPYKFTDIGEGGATVLDRATGEKVGDVEYREKSWNLRRYYVSRWWNAHAPNGRKVAEGGTRRDAAQALYEHSKLPPAVQRVAEAAARIRHSDAYATKSAQEAARRYIEEAIELGAEITVPEGDLSASDLFAWCRAHKEPA